MSYAYWDVVLIRSLKLKAVTKPLPVLTMQTGVTCNQRCNRRSLDRAIARGHNLHAVENLWSYGKASICSKE